MLEAKSICYYSSVKDLIYENTTEAEEKALYAMFETEDDKEQFLHIDDFENYGYFLLDFGKVILTLDSDVIGTFDNLEDFIKVSANEMKEWRERA